MTSWAVARCIVAGEPPRVLRRRFALVGVQHVNRRTDSDPLWRIADAQGIPQVARSVLIWGPDPDDEDGDDGSRKVLATAKNNLSAGKPSAGFIIENKTLESGISAPMLRHLGESQAEAGDLVADQEARSQTQDAIVWLRELLEAGAVEVEIVKKTASDVGISTKCLRTARERVATHSRPGGNQGPYVWTLKPAIGRTGIHGQPRQQRGHSRGQPPIHGCPIRGMDAHVPTLIAVGSDGA